MRKVGIGALGVIGGILLALIVQDLLANAVLSNGTPNGLGIMYGFLMPIFAILGAVIAIVIYNRHTTGKPEKSADE